MKVEVTPEAARRIRRRSNDLYLWLEPVGAAWVRDELSFDRPDSIEFRRYEDAGVDVFIGSDVRAGLVRISAPWLPWRTVDVTVDGRPWGRRGRVSGETGVSYGGAGPP